MKTHIALFFPNQTGDHDDINNGWLAVEYVGKELKWGVDSPIKNFVLSKQGKSAQVEMFDGTTKTVRVIRHQFGNVYVGHNF